MSKRVGNGMKAVGVISVFTGWGGAFALASFLSEPWATIVGWSLFLCVGAAHNWIATEKL